MYGRKSGSDKISSDIRHLLPTSRDAVGRFIYRSFASDRTSHEYILWDPMPNENWLLGSGGHLLVLTSYSRTLLHLYHLLVDVGVNSGLIITA